MEDTRGPLMVPVGKAIRSRMFNVFGQTIDRAGDLADVELRSVHRSPPTLAERITQSEIFETGIKAIDVLMPLERGGKAGLFGGAGVGKTVLLTEMIHNMIRNNIMTASACSAALASAAARAKNCIARCRSRCAAQHGDGLRPDERAAG